MKKWMKIMLIIISIITVVYIFIELVYNSLPGMFDLTGKKRMCMGTKCSDAKVGECITVTEECNHNIFEKITYIINYYTN